MSNSRSRGRGDCPHDVYIKGLCGNCGIRLDPPQSNSVSMVHSVPELKVTEEYAKRLGKADQETLIQERKLVLLVDLDQTVLHTTHEEVKNDPNVHPFKLWPGHPTYYTKLRPHLKQFLDSMSQIYELHIFTFGCRMYAHKIASIIDPKQKYFGNRILSRNESKDLYSKLGNLNDLFPCGDAMVCIIDDRADVWRDAANLIQVKPYTYFKTSISDGAMMAAAGTSAEEAASLDRDVGMLEALLGEEDDGDGDAKEKATGTSDDDDEDGEVCTDSSSDEGEKEPVVAQQEVEIETAKSEGTSERRGTKRKECGADEGEEEALQSPLPPAPQVSEQKSEPIEDNDNHLVKLQTILSHIHDKWYMELDERRSYLVEGENYKLPDIKDIIRRYLRKR